MNSLIFGLFVVASIGAAYWFILRPVLRQRPELAGVYKLVDMTKTGWWVWFKLHLSGLKTKLWARIIWLSSLLVTMHDSLATFAGTLDWTPVTARVLAPIPPDLRPLVLSGSLVLIAGSFEWLRRFSSTPPDVPTQAAVTQVVEQVASAENRVADVGAELAKIADATPTASAAAAAPITAAKAEGAT